MQDKNPVLLKILYIKFYGGISPPGTPPPWIHACDTYIVQ